MTVCNKQMATWGHPSWCMGHLLLRGQERTSHGPLDRYVRVCVAHAPGMPGTFSPPPRVRDPDMYHGTFVTHVTWCMSGSLTGVFLWSQWRGKRSRHSRSMRNPQLYVSGKRPIVEGPMNQKVYLRVLRQNLLSWTRGIFRNNFVLVQDNAPPHKVRATMTFLENQDVKVMDWPGKNPDVNLFEHIWDQMDIYSPPKTQQQLHDAVMAAWDNVRPERLRLLVRSMPRPVRAVQDARGKHKQY